MDLNDVKIVKQVGGTIDDTELVKGLVFTQKASHAAGGPTKVANAKIALIQFCLSAPKTDIEQNVVVSDYSQMDRILKEERKYILDMCKKIQKSGALTPTPSFFPLLNWPSKRGPSCQRSTP